MRTISFYSTERDAASDLWLTKDDIWEYQHILIEFLILGHIPSLGNCNKYASKIIFFQGFPNLLQGYLG